jgi:hypothetical protein
MIARATQAKYISRKGRKGNARKAAKVFCILFANFALYYPCGLCVKNAFLNSIR